MIGDIFTRITDFLDKGGLTIWAIAALSVLTVAIILWKTWRLMLLGAWSRSHTTNAVAKWVTGEAIQALGLVSNRQSIRAKVARRAMEVCDAASFDIGNAREETTRVAKNLLADARSGLRALELISTIAPLLGLLGTVMGMIVAFQALQDAGSRADPAALAGGIWEALLTTAAGMAVAIPASAALSWFESVIDRIRLDLEDLSTQIFIHARKPSLPLAAE